MARIYARKRGKSRSKKPPVAGRFVDYKPEEVERLVAKLAKDNMQTATIGRVMRDQYGITSVRATTGKRILSILDANSLSPKIPEDLINLMRRAVSVRNHMKINPKDSTSKRGLELLESKIRRLVKYYVREERLPKGWVYDPERAKLILQTGG